MQQSKPRLERPNARARFVIVAILIVEFAGCANELTSNPGRPPMEVAPYVGMFTETFVGGKPLYRFPTIEVVGSRSSAAPDT